MEEEASVRISLYLLILLIILIITVTLSGLPLSRITCFPTLTVTGQILPGGTGVLIYSAESMKLTLQPLKG
ncbi:MAG: hypothetical protein BWY89_01401 [Bacteroidetes bacterium ADurb.BinA012]|nr:MAG: hypothetical protein BWY89_01401 [Bacteroidetes bacterium ADurb.BinA012]